jgi:uncharacterized protein (TIGR02646 family)
MIYCNRPPGSCPASLDLRNARSAASKERTKVIQWIVANRPDPSKMRPAFAAYKNKDVGPALESLFKRKCAYCESSYGATHPVDVEHWRPKAEIDGVNGSGYEWLAMAWENLLPSCIDCNRSRKQLVPDPDKPGEWKEVNSGKANQFPVADEAKRLIDHNSPLEETPLLLDPCHDDPSEYFDFPESGIVLPRSGLDDIGKRRALESIRVYALNRKGLVDERRRHVLWLELEFRLVRFLFSTSGDFRLPSSHRSAAEVLLKDSLQRLGEMANGAMPYSQFISTRLRRFIVEELGAGIVSQSI